MTRVLEELTAGAACWTAGARCLAKQAVAEIVTLRAKEAAHLVRREAPTAAALTAFQHWLGGQADVTNVEVKHVGGHGNGLMATKDMREGDAFIYVPYAILLSVDASLGPTTTVDESQWSQVVQDPLLSTFPSCRLALRVLGEACKPEGAGQASFFEPYLAMLPTTFDIPLFYDASDFEAIDGTPLFEPAAKLLYNSIKQFFYLQRLRRQVWTKCPIPIEKFTLSNYFWALGVVLTRQNEVAASENGRTVMALIPGWDMCNHELGPRITTFSDPVKQVVVCHAKRDFQTNEEVTMFYGPRSNQQLVIYSGFVADSNPHDRVAIALSLTSSSDPLFKIRRMVIQKEVARDPSIVFQDESLSVQVGEDGSLASYAALRVLQVLCLSKDNLTKALRLSASVGPAQVYEWTPDERELTKTRFFAGCADAEKSLRSQLLKVSSALHGALFQRYLKSQLRATVAAKGNDAVFTI